MVFYQGNSHLGCWTTRISHSGLIANLALGLGLGANLTLGLGLGANLTLGLGLDRDSLGLRLELGLGYDLDKVRVVQDASWSQLELTRKPSSPLPPPLPSSLLSL